VRIREHRHNLELGLLEKSQLAQLAYEEDHKVDWDKARVFGIENISRFRKYKDQLTWHVQPICSVNLVWIFRPFGSPP
jgi:hypothetical protein